MLVRGDSSHAGHRTNVGHGRRPGSRRGTGWSPRRRFLWGVDGWVSAGWLGGQAAQGSPNHHLRSGGRPWRGLLEPTW